MVDRKTLKEIDKVMSEHSRAWCGIWSTGKTHNQEDRIITSKSSKSENTAKLYLTFKDHKVGAEKTRPIGTANTSNTRGFANSVSDLIESIANGETKSYEVISSEDMLHYVEGHNKKVELAKIELEKKKRLKIECKKCKI